MSKKLPLLRVPFYSPIETQANTISPLRWANLTTKKRWSCLCNERETVELRTRRAATATYSQIQFIFFLERKYKEVLRERNRNVGRIVSFSFILFVKSEISFLPQKLIFWPKILFLYPKFESQKALFLPKFRFLVLIREIFL